MKSHRIIPSKWKLGRNTLINKYITEGLRSLTADNLLSFAQPNPSQNYDDHATILLVQDYQQYIALTLPGTDFRELSSKSLICVF